MKTRLIVSLFLALCGILQNNATFATTDHLEPGVVYSDGKDAFFHELIGGEKVNLTSDSSDIRVNGLFAASENGRFLGWVQNEKLMMRELPNGRIFEVTVHPTPIPKAGYLQKKKLDPNAKYTFAGGAKSMNLSPDGTVTAYGFVGTGMTWSISNMPIKKDNLAYGVDTAYEMSFGNCLAVNVLKTDSPNTLMPTFFDTSFYHGFGGLGACANGMFGNTASYCPPKLPCQMAESGAEGWMINEYMQTPKVYPFDWDIHVTWQEAMSNFAVQRNAYYYAFSKPNSWNGGEKYFAIMYQSSRGFGSIEIFDLDSQKLKTTKRPGIYVIPMALANCQGIAWTPEGGLSIVSNGKVGVIPKQLISATIEASSIVMDNSVNIANANYTSNALTAKAVARRRPKNPVPVAANNRIPFTPTIVAEGIAGNSICWTSETSFLIQGSDRFLYSWSAGKLEKLFELPCIGFSYCSTSPFANKKPVPPVNDVATKIPTGIQDLDNSVNPETGPVHSPEFPPNCKRIYRTVSPKLDKIPLWPENEKIANHEEWLKNPFDLLVDFKSATDKNVPVELKFDWKVKKQKKVSYCIFKQQSMLESIIDPSKHEFIEGVKLPLRIKLNFGEVILFKDENCYVALKPVLNNSKAKGAAFILTNWWKYGFARDPLAVNLPK